jgi:hypothetical protein
MSDDRFFDRLRDDARQLRYEPDNDAVWTRLAARIESGIRSEPTVSQLLARWFRPVAASLAALSVAGALTVQWIDQSRETVTVESIVAAAEPAHDFGDAFGVE